MMFRKLIKIFDKLYDKKISASGLAIFRITFYLNLLFEVIHIFEFRQLYFDEIPFLKVAAFNMTYPLLLWCMILLFLVFGCFTKIASIINYLFCFFILSSFTDFEYHMHYVYVGISFLTIFLPVSRVLSIDSLYVKKYKLVSVLYYYLPVFTGIGLVYLDSIFYKFTSNIWMGGLGVWYPASLPQITILNDQWLLNQKWLMLFMGYLTLAFETVFVFFFWKKKARIPFFIIGLGLHIGILLEFPIPNFALGIIAIYLLMVPVKFWDMILVKYSVALSLPKKKPYNFEVERNEPKSMFTLKVLICLCILLQLNVTLQSDFMKPVTGKIVHKLKIQKLYNILAFNLHTFSRKGFGITKHPVFMDNHFKDYNHLIRITYVSNDKTEVNIPILDAQGMPDDLLRGGVWVNWSYRVNSQEVRSSSLEKGVIAYTSFWAHKNNVSLLKAKFRITVKRITLPTSGWEKDYLDRQLKVKWVTAGELQWSDLRPEFKLIKEIEEF